MRPTRFELATFGLKGLRGIRFRHPLKPKMEPHRLQGKAKGKDNLETAF